MDRNAADYDRYHAGPDIDDSLPLCLFPGNATHLQVLRADGTLQDPVSEGRHGCDYMWGAGSLTYRCKPHRWAPDSDEGYADWQGEDSQPWEDYTDWALDGNGREA